MNSTMINDFGKKIGGARKDTWKGRGLSLSDLYEMTAEEKKVFVKKDNVWEKPDWTSLIAAGADKAVSFWKNEVRKSLPKDPSSMLGEDRNERYVAFVQAVRDHVMELTSMNETRKILTWLKTDGYLVPITPYYCDVPKKWEGVINRSFFKAIQKNTFDLCREKSYPLFGVAKEDADYVLIKNRLKIYFYEGEDVAFKTETRGTSIRKYLSIHEGYATHFYYPEKIEEYEKTWIKNSWIIVDSGSRDIIAYNLCTEKEAADTVEKIARAAAEIAPKKTAARASKTIFHYPQLSWVERKGTDYRNGFHATPELLMDTFGFRGGEFGNWLGDKERQENLNQAYDALMDLADILETDPKNLTFHGTLSIAFGSRGKGGAAAATAHYEPLRRVINLTRMKGAGCLAHEWAHALDHSLAGTFSKPGSSELLASECRISPDAPESWKKLLSALKRKEDGTFTDFYVASDKFDQIHRKSGHGYWSSTCEMFARAFDCYIADKLREKGLRSDYLTAHSDCFVEEMSGTTYHAYPVGNERERLNQLFDALIADLKGMVNA